MKANVELITPEKAEIYLKQNTQNRKLRKTWVESLSQAMLKGQYSLTHQGIAFDVNGVLIDGQHRLSAIVKSGVAQYVLVVTGVPVDAYKNVDIGVKRTHSDTTKLNSNITEVINKIAKFIYGENKLTADDVLNYYSVFGESIDSFFLAATPTAKKTLSASPVRAAAVLQIFTNPSDAEVITERYTKLVLQDQTMSPVIWALSKSVQNGSVTANGKGGIGQPDLFCRAFIAFDSKCQDYTKIQVSDHKLTLDKIRNLVEKTRIERGI